MHPPIVGNACKHRGNRFGNVLAYIGNRTYAQNSGGGDGLGTNLGGNDLIAVCSPPRGETHPAGTFFPLDVHCKIGSVPLCVEALQCNGKIPVTYRKRCRDDRGIQTKVKAF